MLKFMVREGKGKQELIKIELGWPNVGLTEKT